MKKHIENAYEDFCMAALSGHCAETDFYSLDNTLYERMGMSSDEILDMVSSGDIVVMNNIL